MFGKSISGNTIIITIFLKFIVVTNKLSCAQTRADYCNICRDHTLCIYTGRSAVCGQGTSGLTEADKSALVTRHNDIRSKVANGRETRGLPGPQPPASNMRKLVWDDEIAKVADRWAGQCLFGHDACRNVARFYVGQNIAHICSATINVTNAVDSWANGVTRYNRNTVSSYGFNPLSSSYSQVVWANTSKIGCGRSSFIDVRLGLNCNLYVCNYGQGGNIAGQSVYQIGTAASACTYGVNDPTTGLCN